MPKARARLCPTISMTVAPTTASRICVWITADCRGGVPRRRGRKAIAATSTAASGSRTAASTNPLIWLWRFGIGSFSALCSSFCAASASTGSAHTTAIPPAIRTNLMGTSGARAPFEREPLSHLPLHLIDERGDLAVAVTGGAEGVVPLLVGELREPPARPQHVVHVKIVIDAPVEEDRLEREVDLLVVVDAEDEGLAPERLGVVQPAEEEAHAMAERLSDVLDQIDMLRCLTVAQVSLVV